MFTEMRMAQISNYLSPERVRSFVRICFEYLRNLVLIGVLLFLGMKTESRALQIIAFVLTGILGSFTMTFLDGKWFFPFAKIKNERLLFWANVGSHFLILACISIGLSIALFAIVFRVADAYLVK